MYAAIRDTRIYFDVEGQGLVPDGASMRERPVGFVIHGGPGGDHTGFKPGFSPLAGTMQLVYFDHRGHGRSRTADPHADPARFTLDENVEDMEALRRHLGLGRIVSIGTSYGGMVAMAHAARHPEAVSHLILCVTAAHAGFNEAARAIVAARGTPAQKAVTDQLWAGRLTDAAAMEHYYDVMGPMYSVRHDPDSARIGRARGSYSPEPLNRAFRPGGVLRSFDLRPELGRITAPTLILAGKQDWICPPQFSQEIHGLIPQSRLHVFENASHSLRADVPEQLMAAIAGFVTGRLPEFMLAS